MDLGTGFGLGLKGWIAVQVEDAGAEVNEEMPKYPCRSIGALMGRVAFWCMSNHRTLRKSVGDDSGVYSKL